MELSFMTQLKLNCFEITVKNIKSDETYNTVKYWVGFGKVKQLDKVVKWLQLIQSQVWIRNSLYKVAPTISITYYKTVTDRRNMYLLDIVVSCP